VADAHHEVQCAAYANAYVERFIASVRRECLDHMLVFDESGLLRVLRAYWGYYERSRTHLGLAKDTPIPRPIMGDGVVVAIPEIGGLHHRYERRAA
jgi:putative transposase